MFCCIMCFVIQSFFAVDKTSGEVTVMRELDRDIAAVVRITVVVTDTTAPTTQQGRGILHFIHLPASLPVLFRSVKILAKKTRLSTRVCLLKFSTVFVDAIFVLRIMSVFFILYYLFFHSVHPVTNMTSDMSSSVCVPYITLRTFIHSIHNKGTCNTFTSIVELSNIEYI